VLETHSGHITHPTEGVALSFICGLVEWGRGKFDIGEGEKQLGGSEN
jgi:hypothetical protein